MKEGECSAPFYHARNIAIFFYNVEQPLASPWRSITSLENSFHFFAFLGKHLDPWYFHHDVGGIKLEIYRRTLLYSMVKIQEKFIKNCTVYNDVSHGTD